MGLFSVFISFFFLVLSVLIYKRGLTQPLVFFFFVWLVVCIFSVYKTAIFPASEEAFTYIIIMLCCVFMGSLAFFLPDLQLQHSDIELTENYASVTGDLKRASMTTIYLLLLVYIAFSLIDSYIIIKNFFQGTQLWVMRSWRMSTYGVDINPLIERQSFLEVTFRATILYPFQNLVAPISAYFFFNKTLRAKHKKFLWAAVISFFLTIIATGGSRNTIVYFFGCFILYYVLFSEKEFHIKQRIKKAASNVVVVSTILLVAVCLVLFVTNARTNLSVWDSLSSYLGIAPTLLTLHLPEILQSPPTYGFLTFFGLVTYPMRFLQQIGANGFVPEIYTNAFQYVLNAQNFYIISSTGLVRNAYVTPVFYFLIDGGMPFLVFASLFFGIVLGRFSRHFFKSITIKKFVYYSLIMQAILFSFVQVPSVQPSFVFSILLTWILLREA